MKNFIFKNSCTFLNEMEKFDLKVGLKYELEKMNYSTILIVGWIFWAVKVGESEIALKMAEQLDLFMKVTQSC